MEHEFNVALLGLSEVVRMSQDPEASDVGAGMCFVLCDQSGCDVAECGHLVLCSVVGLNQVVLFGISKDLLSFLFVRLEPLHRVDRQSCSQWLSQDERVSRLGKVRHCEVVVFNNSDRASSHHWPGIVDGLASSNLSLSLLSSVSKALDHQSSADIFFQFVHIGRDSKDHQNLLDRCDAHSVEVGGRVAEGDAAEHVRRLDQGIEEIEGGDQSVGRNFDGRDVWCLDADWFGEFAQVGQQFVLWDLTPSPLHFGVVGHNEVSLQAMLDRIKRLHARGFSVCRIF